MGCPESSAHFALDSTKEFLGTSVDKLGMEDPHPPPKTVKFLKGETLETVLGWKELGDLMKVVTVALS